MQSVEFRLELSAWQVQVVDAFARISDVSADLPYAEKLSVLTQPELAFWDHANKRAFTLVNQIDEGHPPSTATDDAAFRARYSSSRAPVSMTPTLERLFGRSGVKLPSLVSNNDFIWIHGPFPHDYSTADLAEKLADPLSWPSFVRLALGLHF